MKNIVAGLTIAALFAVGVQHSQAQAADLSPPPANTNNLGAPAVVLGLCLIGAAVGAGFAIHACGGTFRCVGEVVDGRLVRSFCTPMSRHNIEQHDNWSTGRSNYPNAHICETVCSLTNLFPVGGFSYDDDWEIRIYKTDAVNQTSVICATMIAPTNGWAYFDPTRSDHCFYTATATKLSELKKP